VYACPTIVPSFWTLDGKLKDVKQSYLSHAVVGTLQTALHKIEYSKDPHFFRYKPQPPTAQASPGEDLTPDNMNILRMIFSMCGLMMRVSVLEYVAAIFMFKFITVMICNCH